ncbi:PREDICTED: uncharacterized protein LOC109348170 [Lupinus angustifolius]|uniref:uncharacterized protein LOC109348170 n=1 Tax=Lupinus angustifolius TaxID=3871 RepID=UPI00092F6343|nr:PREDICTED: uncharacterized protein LOC109348170 [Lupinus angustifolius]XP_019443982.1 PREDICTED: uncharacterized protein LOC109348170 [Lupinus angustifolius]
MATLMNFSTKFSHLKPNSYHDSIYYKIPTFSFSQLRPKFTSFHQTSFKVTAYRERWSFLRGMEFKNGILLEEKGFNREKRVVLVKNNKGFGFNFGGGKDDGDNARNLGNLALAIGLTYLTMNGQMGWILDAIVSIWVIVVLIPIVGIGAFLWWAGRDIMQGTCPNCGNDFQVLKPSLNEELQLCPFCGQPFSVIGNEFVEDSVKFSNQSTTFGQAFNNFSYSRNDKDSGGAIDVEAEIKDAD